MKRPDGMLFSVMLEISMQGKGIQENCHAVAILLFRDENERKIEREMQDNLMQ